MVSNASNNNNNNNRVVSILLLLAAVAGVSNGFQSNHVVSNYYNQAPTSQLHATTTTNEADIKAVELSVQKLKLVLEKEYISFFDPMERDYYDTSVTFEDPMTSLSGVDSYQQNVDMLSSRTLMGKFLFEDAGIALHSVTGGDVTVDDTSGKIEIGEITTRWTLRVCAKILPWKPTARFSGISVYKVAPGGKEGVLVQNQIDYWDSINIKPNGNGEYTKVPKNIAVNHFLDQLKPDNFAAPSAGPELPYQLLRCGNGYEVKKYPAFSAVKIPYTRRDEAFSTLGAFTSGIGALSPAIIEIDDASGEKYMMWPLDYAPPNTDETTLSADAKEKAALDLWKSCEIVTIPSRVVAIGTFSDASVEPVVRKCDKALRESIQRDGLVIPESATNKVKFAQYDAIFSMGKRRGEVWIDLEDGGHPW